MADYAVAIGFVNCIERYLGRCAYSKAGLGGGDAKKRRAAEREGVSASYRVVGECPQVDGNLFGLARVEKDFYQLVVAPVGECVAGAEGHQGSCKKDD